MKILVDENCLWLCKEPHRSAFLKKGYRLFGIGEKNCPVPQTPDQQILAWLKENDCAILTNDFDDFIKHSSGDILIFGLPGQGVYLNRSDIIIQCIENCVGTFKPKPVPSGIYILSYYRWD